MSILDSNGKPIQQTGGESDRDDVKHRHDLSTPEHKKNFDQKIFMFPESYNQLRAEISRNWPSLWALVAWRMAYKAEEFVEYMNDALEMRLVFDTEKVSWICEQYLKELHKRRGVQ